MGLTVFRFGHSVSCSVVSDSVSRQATLSMEFSKQEYWSGLPCPPPGDLPNPGIEHRSLALQVDALRSEPPGKPKNTGVGSLSLLQGNFLTQGRNLHLSCTGLWVFHHWRHLGSPSFSQPLPILQNCKD